MWGLQKLFIAYNFYDAFTSSQYRGICYILIWYDWSSGMSLKHKYLRNMIWYMISKSNVMILINRSHQFSAINKIHFQKARHLFHSVMFIFTKVQYTTLYIHRKINTYVHLYNPISHIYVPWYYDNVDLLAVQAWC